MQTDHICCLAKLTGTAVKGTPPQDWLMLLVLSKQGEDLRGAEQQQIHSQSVTEAV